MSILLPVTILAVIAMAFVVYSLVQVVRNDGPGRPRLTPPRSHEPDMFAPHRLA